MRATRCTARGRSCAPRLAAWMSSVAAAYDLHGARALMETVHGRPDDRSRGVISPSLQRSPVGRRRRPSGEAPPLPRYTDRTTHWYVVSSCAMLAFWIALAFRPVLRAVDIVDLGVLRGIADVRTVPVTHVMLALQHLGSSWVTRVLAWATLIALVAF